RERPAATMRWWSVPGRKVRCSELHDIAGREEAVKFFVVPNEICIPHTTGIFVTWHRADLPSNNVMQMRAKSIITLLSRVAGLAGIIEHLLPQSNFARGEGKPDADYDQDHCGDSARNCHLEKGYASPGCLYCPLRRCHLRRHNVVGSKQFQSERRWLLLPKSRRLCGSPIRRPRLFHYGAYKTDTRAVRSPDKALILTVVADRGTGRVDPRIHGRVRNDTAAPD